MWPHHRILWQASWSFWLWQNFIWRHYSHCVQGLLLGAALTSKGMQLLSFQNSRFHLFAGPFLCEGQLGEGAASSLPIGSAAHFGSQLPAPLQAT